MIVQKYKYQFKYIIIGDTGVGKSCLVLQFVQKSVKQSHDITIGVEFAKKLININNLPIQLQLWDTAGQENFRSITRQYYKSAIGALLVYDITRRDSFLSVEKWLEELKDNSDHNISIILVGNKKDMANRREVEFDEGYALAQKYNLLFSEASAFNGEGVDKIFLEPARQIYQKIENEEIDISQCNGVKLGNLDEDFEKKNGKNDKINNISKKDNNNESSCC